MTLGATMLPASCARLGSGVSFGEGSLSPRGPLKPLMCVLTWVQRNYLCSSAQPLAGGRHDSVCAPVQVLSTPLLSATRTPGRLWGGQSRGRMTTEASTSASPESGDRYR